jgi:hypothetical protein
MFLLQQQFNDQNNSLWLAKIHEISKSYDKETVPRYQDATVMVWLSSLKKSKSTQ